MDEHQPNQGEDMRLKAAESDANTSETRDVDLGLEYRQRRAMMLKGAREHREFHVTDMECRALDDGTMRWTGIASTTETFYDIGDPERGGFRERIQRNAFKRTLSEDPDVVLLGNHEGWPLARTKNGSLSLRETPAGLQWTADLDPEDPDTKSLGRKIERGLVSECSFAFLCTDDAWNDDYTERTVKAVSLHRGDVSVVTHGANAETAVTLLRSADGAFELRAGKSISAANTTALQGVLDHLARADVEIDAALVEQSAVLGVPNPDADDAEPDADDGARAAEPEVEERKPVPLPDYTTRARERLAALRRAS